MSHLIHDVVIAVETVAVFAVLFGAGLATSFAEYKFKYSLYETVAAKLTGKKS